MFVPAEVYNFLVDFSGRSLVVRMMIVEGFSEGHSSVVCLVREIPKWKLPYMRQRLGSPVGCSLPYFVCWSGWVERLYKGGHTILLVGKLGCATLLDGRFFQSTSAVGGRFAS